MPNTVAMAWVHFARSPSELYLKTGADDAAVTFELVSQSASASIGDVSGQVITGIDVQVGDGSTLTYIQLTDSSGGQQLQVKSGERVSAGGSVPSSNMNACITPLSILVERGSTINVLTAD